MEKDDSSVKYADSSLESASTTVPTLSGARRLFDNVYSRLGKSLEYSIFAKLQGSGPQEVGARIRGMSVWQTPAGEEDGLAFRRLVVLELNDLKTSDTKMLRRCCKAIIYYMCFGSPTTVILALQEMIVLSIRYSPVRETFVTLQAIDTLHVLPLYLKQARSCELQQLHDIELLAEKAQACLQDNVLYSACRETFLSPSCMTEIDNVKLCLVLESFTDHVQLQFIATDLLVFFQLKRKKSDARSFSGVIERLPFWQEYAYKKHSVGIQDLRRDESDILMRHCQVLLSHTKSYICMVKIAALVAIVELSRRYRSVREALITLGALDDFLHINDGEGEKADTTSHRLEEIQNLASGALFSLQDNEVYELVKESTLRKPWASEIEGAVLRLQLLNYLSHPKLETIVKEYLSLLQLSSSTFDRFLLFARHLLDPPSNDFGGGDKKHVSVNRASYVLVNFATGGYDALETRIKACGHIETMIFSHPSSRAYFQDVGLPARLVRITESISPSDSESDHEQKQLGRFLERSARITLCLQDHEVFPKTISYFKEFNGIMLDMIFNYLRTPELFFIGAKVLAKTWLKVLFRSKDLFCRVISFLLDTMKEIAIYAEAELLVVSVLEEILWERKPVWLHFASHYAEVCSSFIDTLSSPEYRSLYPTAYGTIQEYRSHVDLILYDLPVSHDEIGKKS